MQKSPKDIGSFFKRFGVADWRQNLLNNLVWLYGPRRGNKDSDFDVTIIATDENKDLWDTTIDVVAEHSLENDCLISILLFSKERFERMKSIGRLLARNIERDGITLWNRAA